MPNDDAIHEGPVAAASLLQTVPDLLFRRSGDRCRVVGNRQRNSVAVAAGNRRDRRRRSDGDDWRLAVSSCSRPSSAARPGTGCASSSTASAAGSSTTCATISSHTRDARRRLVCTDPHRRHHGAPHQRPERGADGGRAGRHVPRQHHRRWRCSRFFSCCGSMCGSRCSRSCQCWSCRCSHSHGQGDPRPFRGRTGALLHADDARAGKPARRANRPRVPPGGSGDRALRAINEEYLAINMSLVRLWGTLNPLFAFSAASAR